MKRILIIIFVFVAGLSLGDVVTLDTAGDTVSFTNSQSNSAWSPSALIYTRATEEPVTLSIYRHGNGQPVLLAAISATASNLIWIPQTRYIFNGGSSLVLISSVSTFSVQLHREPAHE